MKPIYYTNHLRKLLKKYRDKPWDWMEIKRNPNFSKKSSQDDWYVHYTYSYEENQTNPCKSDCMDYPKTYTKNNILIVNHKFMKYSSKINDILIECPDMDWDFDTISSNYNLDIETVKKTKDKPWNWNKLSENLNMTWEIIQDNLNLPWNYKFVTKNFNITWDIIESNPSLPWDWWKVISTKTWSWTSLKKIIPYIDMGKTDSTSFWSVVSGHINITWDIVKSNPNIRWDWYGLSQNPNLTYEIIRDNIGLPWDWTGLSLNRFEKNKGIERKHNKHNARYYLNNVLISDIINIITNYL